MTLYDVHRVKYSILSLHVFYGGTLQSKFGISTTISNKVKWVWIVFGCTAWRIVGLTRLNQSMQKYEIQQGIYCRYKIKNMKLQTCSFSKPNSTYSISQWQRLSKYSTEYMSAGEELWIYHDTVSPLSYSSAPHGSCHTLKGQKNRLNMVRLAFLLTKLRGVWARCRWTPLNGGVCVHERDCICLQVTWRGTWYLTGHDVSWKSECPMWRRSLPLCWFSWNVECFSSLTVRIFAGFHVQRNFPWKPSA